MTWGIFSVFLILLLVISGLTFLPQILFMLEAWSVKRSEKED